jgi:rhomboid-like protein
MLEIWLKLESNRYPFKVKFVGKDIYDLKKEVIAELEPMLRTYATIDIGIRFSKCEEVMLENVIVESLFLKAEPVYAHPWLVVLPEPEPAEYTHYIEKSIDKIHSVITWIRLSALYYWDSVRNFRFPHGFFQFPNIHWLTICIVAELLFSHFEPFSVFSITILLLIGITVGYFLLGTKPDLLDDHFTSSPANLAAGRWYTLVTSSFAHKDINHLLCNIVGIVITLPIVEDMMGLRKSILFICLSSVFSSFTSIQISGRRSIGASGIVYALEGYLMKKQYWYGYEVDWAPYLIEQVLFAVANYNDSIDHWSHIGGFIFGLIFT